MRCASSSRQNSSSVNRRLPYRSVSVAAATLAIAAAVGFVLVARAGASGDAYTMTPLVSDGGVHAPHVDRTLVNAWGLAASPTGPWPTGNEARGTSTLYSSTGRKQLLTISVPGGPTGVAYYGGTSFLVRGNARSDPARFVYACEDGNIRAWTPTVPTDWSAKAEVTVDQTGKGAIFRGVAFAHGLLYATDFHNGIVEVFNGTWQRVRLAGSFHDPDVSAWYAPDGIYAAGITSSSPTSTAPRSAATMRRSAVTSTSSTSRGASSRASRARACTSRGALRWRRARSGASAATSSSRTSATARSTSFRQDAKGWKKLDGVLKGPNGKALDVDGVWGIAFGNGGLAGSRDTLFAAAGPHQWHGSSELQVHGLISAIAPS